jgi:hypothetical protein
MRLLQSSLQREMAQTEQIEEAKKLRELRGINDRLRYWRKEA